MWQHLHHRANVGSNSCEMNTSRRRPTMFASRRRRSGRACRRMSRHVGLNTEEIILRQPQRNFHRREEIPNMRGRRARMYIRTSTPLHTSTRECQSGTSRWHCALSGYARRKCKLSRKSNSFASFRMLCRRETMSRSRSSKHKQRWSERNNRYLLIYENCRFQAEEQDRIRKAIVDDVDRWRRNRSIRWLLNSINDASSGNALYLPPYASLTAIRKVYKRSLLKIHPDKHTHCSLAERWRAEETFKAVNEIYTKFCKLQGTR